MIDDGNNGDFIEANYDNDIAVRWKPSLSRLEITRLQLLNIGKTFRIKLKAKNYAGEVESPILGVVLAGVP
jgi:secreted trypsin-like serine protease